MDSSVLTCDAFWNDPRPFAAGEIPDLAELAGHVLFETSGSSGNPKWVALSKQALLVSARAVNEHLQVTEESRWGLALPLNHVGGFGVAARSYAAGCGMETYRGRWNPILFGGWVARAGVTHTSLVPTQVHDLVKAGLEAPPALKAIVVGGGHLDPATGRAARDLGWPVLASYGMSEAASQIATQGLDLLEMPYQSAPIPLLPVWQAETSPEGLLSIAGPALFSGYVRDGCFTPRTSPWHLTTDRVLLEDRQLTPMGRADNRVKVLGELVDPESIERELAELSGGRLSPGTYAVVAVPDERAGNVLLPVFESALDPALVASVLELYDKRAAGFRRLRSARFISDIPHSGLGKIKRAELMKLI
ncbi:AMP-binding protein [Luteolibacter yonseiensis]|uniref:AMP-binding protein n=1 Tax=Luteolibacter yonseiensis TaxID=1144680 RepID=A0A934V689_9BACT|nr:AMP-binding protein [Luteolibacter yonseiensis]MBK1814777.1 AMP-binding protein [Luteolibacter yonseiensis]